MLAERKHIKCSSYPILSLSSTDIGSEAVSLVPARAGAAHTFTNHLSDDDLECYCLGTHEAEPELSTLEDHLLACAFCVASQWNHHNA